MPTVKGFGHCRICIYAGDHNPPHFHILSPEFDVQVTIATMEILRGARHVNKVRVALEWAERNKAELSLKWIELNERD